MSLNTGFQLVADKLQKTGLARIYFLSFVVDLLCSELVPRRVSAIILVSFEGDLKVTLYPSWVYSIHLFNSNSNFFLIKYSCLTQILLKSFRQSKNFKRQIVEISDFLNIILLRHDFQLTNWKTFIESFDKSEQKKM